MATRPAKGFEAIAESRTANISPSKPLFGLFVVDVNMRLRGNIQNAAIEGLQAPGFHVVELCHSIVTAASMLVWGSPWVWRSDCPQKRNTTIASASKLNVLEVLFTSSQV